MTNDLPPLPDMPPSTPAPEPLAVPVPAAPKKRLGPLAAGLIGLATGAAIVGATWAITATGDDSTSTAGSKKPTAAHAVKASPDTFTLTGDFQLTDGATSDGLGGCEGTGGYDDISEGASITVYDAAGAVIATGALGSSSYDAPTCTFDVSINNVPGGQHFYKVEVSHRGTVQLSADEAKNGLFEASLG
jgi:hypothetical protein